MPQPPRELVLEARIDVPKVRPQGVMCKEIARRFAELTRAVAASENPCHQYLDAGETDEITVMVSKDEYDESLFAL
jgi:hypothetical protein